MQTFTKEQMDFMKKNKDKIKQDFQNMSLEEQNKIKQISQNTINQNNSSQVIDTKNLQNFEWYNESQIGIPWVNMVNIQNPTQNNIKNEQENFQKNNLTQSSQIQNNIPKIENDPRVSIWNQNQEKTSPLTSSLREEGKIQENTQTQNNLNLQNPQNQTIDYENWNVESWKSRWSKKDELENAIEKKYGTVASWKEDWSLEAVINGEKFSWKIDWQGNPVKTSLWQANQGDINKNNFLGMLQNGSSVNDLNDYIYKNNLQDDPVIKKQMEQKYLDDFQKPILEKYKNYSLEELHKAVKNGEIIPWTPVFEKLPQASAYNKMKSSFNIIDSRKEDDFTWVNVLTNIEKIADTTVSKFFDQAWIQEQINEFKNNPELAQYRDEVSKYQKDIIDKKRKLKDIWDVVRRQMQWSNEAMIQAEIARQAEYLLRDIDTTTNLMNSSLAMIDMKKSDFEVQMKMLSYKDEIKQKQFWVSQEIYYKERVRMDEKEKREFEVKTEELAFQRQKAWELEKMELAEKYKWWNYETDINWNLIYIKNGVAEKVRDKETWELVGMQVAQNYQDNIYKNEYGGYDILRTYKDWKAPDRFSVWATWKMSGWMSFWLMDLISNISDKWKWPNGWVWCWEWVNRYLKNAWITSIRISDSWKSKKDLIDSKEPVIWWLVAFAVPWKFAEYWHIWIVTWINWDKVQITDWNAKWDWKKNTYEKSISSILNSEWWFINNFLWEYIEKNPEKFTNNNQNWNENYWNSWNNLWETGEVWNYYDNENIPLYEKYLKWKMTKEDWWRIWENEKIFKQKANIYSQEQKAETEKNKSTPLLELYNLTKEIREKPSFAWMPGTNDAFKRKLEYIRNNFTFEKLQELKASGATFGSLSDSELKTIASAATMLKDPGFSTYDKDWRDYVDNVLRKIEVSLNKIWIDTRTAWQMTKEEIEQKYAWNKTKEMTKKDLDKAQGQYFRN